MRKLVIAIAVLGVAGCATLPPAQPARDIKSIAGKWECTIATANVARVKSTMTIGDDGVVPPAVELG
jgi:hypothetical protein